MCERLLSLWLSVSLAALLAPCSAQAPGELDFEPTQLPLVTIPPNGATHTLVAAVTYTGQNLELNAPLTIAAGGELRLLHSTLRVRGNVLLQEGGRITVIDSDLLLPNTFQQQYELRIEGGLLHTQRATIGSGYVGANLSQTRLLHLRGTWLARHTVVQALATILSDGRNGWFGDPRWKGGSVFAKGLFEGDRTDAIHMSGMGDGSFVDGTMNIGFYYDAGAPTAPTSAVVDLTARTPLTLVYGDPTVHAGVTVPLPANPCRIELQNHRVPTWQFSAINATQAGPLQTLTLRNAEDVICNYRGTDLVGAPALGGPWGSYYSQLPGLPSTARPGHHAIPPNCSVRIGNVQFQSGSGVNDWNRIRAWGIYVRGTNTNLTVTGPTQLAELQLTDGQLHLSGIGSFDMGVFANTVRLYNTALLTIDDACLGDLGVNVAAAGLIEANDQATCTISNVRTGLMRLRTTSAAASITAQNVFGVQNLILDNPGGGTLQVAQAGATQATDLQNLGFESALLPGNVPPYWATVGGSGSLVADIAPGAAGTSSYAFTASASNASLSKQLVLPAQTFVTLVGAAKVTQTPGSGFHTLTVTQGATSASRNLNGTLLNAWQRAHVPLLTTGFVATPVTVQFRGSGLPANVRLDDFRVAIGSWWEEDNLGNLCFEGSYRHQGAAPDYLAAPDAWRSFRIACSADSGILRPGAPIGSRSMHGTLRDVSGDVYKHMTWVRAGDTVLVTGWARGTGGGSANQQVVVGNGATFYVVGPPNVHSGPLPCDGTWRQFNLTYVVPSNPSYARIDLGCFGAAGNEFWFDDVTVSIQ